MKQKKLQFLGPDCARKMLECCSLECQKVAKKIAKKFKKSLPKYLDIFMLTLIIFIFFLYLLFFTIIANSGRKNSL